MTLPDANSTASRRLPADGGPDAAPANEATYPRTVHLKFLRSRPDLLALLVLAAVSGVVFDSWWVRQLSQLFSRAWVSDLVAGVVVGLMPLVVIAVGAHWERRRWLARLGMVLLGWSVGTEPYSGWAFADKPLAHEYASHLPGYLPGFGIGLLFGVIGFAALDFFGRI